MKGFVQDIEGLAVKNNDFRQVLYTAKHCQLVVMALKPKEMARHQPGKGTDAWPLTFRKAGYAPKGYTLYTYAAFQVWPEAVKQAGTTDAMKVAEVLRQNTYGTVLGDLRFDHKGDVIDPTIVLYKWSKGDYYQLPTL